MTKDFRIRKFFRISDFVVLIALVSASAFFINSIVSDTNATTADQLVIDGINLSTPVENIELKGTELIEMVMMKKEDISMFDLTRPAEEDTIILMTCAGKATGNHDFTHRLVITAVAK